MHHCPCNDTLTLPYTKEQPTPALPIFNSYWWRKYVDKLNYGMLSCENYICSCSFFTASLYIFEQKRCRSKIRQYFMSGQASNILSSFIEKQLQLLKTDVSMGTFIFCIFLPEMAQKYLCCSILFPVHCNELWKPPLHSNPSCRHVKQKWKFYFSPSPTHTAAICRHIRGKTNCVTMRCHRDSQRKAWQARVERQRKNNKKRWKWTKRVEERCFSSLQERGILEVVYIEKEEMRK